MRLISIFDKNMVDLFELDECSKAYVYVVDTDQCNNSLATFWVCLSANEQAQAIRYHSKLLTDRYIISHGILRYILSYYIKQSPKSLEFITNKYGKPSLKGSNIKFNMSHSHNIVCYIIAFNNKVGIDIEVNDNNLDIMELSKLVLTTKENMLLESLEYDEQRKTFYDLWTKKEALVKAIGEGLSYPINTIEALSMASGDKVTLTSINNSVSQELYTYTLELELNYSAAIATETKINEIVYIKIHDQHQSFNRRGAECLHY